MKNLFRQIPGQLVLSLLLVCSFSCEGPEGPAGQAGPVGPQGAVGATGPQGESGLSAFKIINFETTEEGWFADGEIGEVGFSVLFPKSIPEINASIASSGAVLAFAELFAGNGITFWSPLPFSLNTGEDYSSHIGYFYSAHSAQNPTNFLINTYDTDNLVPTFASQKYKIRVVILSGEVGARLDLDALKGMSWEDLEKILSEL